jgi:hypothetical protein
LYQYAKKEAQKHCLDKVTLPCSSNGTFVKDAKCLFLDAGCGQSCLDEVVDMLNLETREEL